MPFGVDALAIKEHKVAVAAPDCATKALEAINDCALCTCACKACCSCMLCGVYNGVYSLYNSAH